MAALPTTPAPDHRWKSPVAATVKLVTGSEPARRRAAVTTALLRLVAAIRETGLILAGVAAIVLAAFLAYPIAGLVVLGLALLVLDWCRRDGQRVADRGSQ